MYSFESLELNCCPLSVEFRCVCLIISVQMYVIDHLSSDVCPLLFQCRLMSLIIGVKMFVLDHLSTLVYVIDQLHVLDHLNSDYVLHQLSAHVFENWSSDVRP